MRRWMTALVLTLGACGPEKNESTESPSGSSTTGSTTEATAGAEPTTTLTSGSGTGGASEGTGTTMNGVCGDAAPPDAEQQCASQDRGSCDELAIDGGSCVWIAWFPVRLMDGVCGFGDPRGQCAFVPCSEEGCAAVSPCGPEGFGGGFIVGENDVVSVGFADWCLGPPAPAQACIFDFEGQLTEGPPECACLCDAGFPGAG